jgi:pimeloyl-ACP methyl ester carboxylesterase
LHDGTLHDGTVYTADVDGCPIAYRRGPAADGRAVVLIHGNSSSSRAWEPLLAGPFGREHRCLALDLPGHGDSARLAPGQYTIARFAALLAGFAAALDASDAVFVGWSLGGHILLEAAPLLTAAAGFVLFGTPPVASPADMAAAFLPDPAFGLGLSDRADPGEAREYAQAFVAPGSAAAADGFARDIARTDPAARAAIGVGIALGAFADEAAIVAGLKQPLAVLHGAQDRLVNADYIRGLTMPTLWRGEVQVIEGAGHAPHQEATEAFTGLLGRFIAQLPAAG